MSETQSPHESQARIDEFKERTSRRLVDLLKPGVPIAEIAQVLGAEDLLTIEKAGRGQEVVCRFNVASFIQRQIDQGTFLGVPDSIEKVDDVMLPPDPEEGVQHGSGKVVEGRTVTPRSQYLAEILTELKQPYKLVLGTNTSDMMRQKSYQMFIIDGLQKIVLVNNERANATFIVSVEPGEDYGIYYKSTKEQLKSLGEPKVQTVAYLGDKDQWKAKVKAVITRLESSVNETISAGWRNLVSLAAENGVSRQFIGKIIDRYRGSHPEWFDKYRNRAKLEVECYHPELVEQVKKDLAARGEKAPEGWLNNRVLAGELGVDEATSLSMVDEYRKDKSVWFKFYLAKNNQPSEHFDPELVRLVKEEFARYEPAPSNWQNATVVGSSIGIKHTVAKQRLDAIVAGHPDWKGTFRSDSNQIVDFFHPDAVEELKRQLKK